MRWPWALLGCQGSFCHTDAEEAPAARPLAYYWVALLTYNPDGFWGSTPVQWLTFSPLYSHHLAAKLLPHTTSFWASLCPSYVFAVSPYRFVGGVHCCSQGLGHTELQVGSSGEGRQVEALASSSPAPLTLASWLGFFLPSITAEAAPTWLLNSYLRSWLSDDTHLFVLTKACGQCLLLKSHVYDSDLSGSSNNDTVHYRNFHIVSFKMGFKALDNREKVWGGEERYRCFPFPICYFTPPNACNS